MGFVTIGIFAVTVQGIEGGIFQMFSHGIVSAALFLCVGIIYDRMHTREISAYGGLVHRMPIYAFTLALFALANVGLPGTSGFVGEFLSILGVFQVNTMVALLATSGVVLSATYMLYMYRRVIFGPLLKIELKSIKDMNLREIAVLAPLIVGAIVFGVWPAPVLRITEASVQQLVAGYREAVAEHKATKLENSLSAVSVAAGN
jgi:NADH-quinone oxidoreductase subunit M